MEFFKFKKPRDPVILALCTQEAFQKSLEKAKRRVEKREKAKIREEKKGFKHLSRQINIQMITTKKLTEVFIKIDVKDNNVEQAIKSIKTKIAKRGFFQSNEDEKHL